MMNFIQVMEKGRNRRNSVVLALYISLGFNLYI